MKIFVFTKKTGVACLAVLLLILSLFWFGRASSIPVSGEKRDLPVYCVKKPDDEKVIAISFDAAWGNEDTETLINILEKYNVKTTFFVVGSWVDKYPDSVKQLSDAGHEVMNHSNSHPHLTTLSKEQIKAEAEKCGEKIEKITKKKPNLFRPPYGDYNNTVISTLRECGYYSIQWDVDSLDWKNLSPEEITERVLSRVKPGSIVLFHNAAENTPKALPVILESLQKDGYRIVPVSQLILTDNYTIDQSGMQIPLEKVKKGE